jgi:hypothetical protein
MSKSEKKQAASIVWFEIPADNPERAKAFYSNLFGWKINPFPGAGDYWHIDTGGPDDTPDGALKSRKHPQEPITNYKWVISPCARIPRVTRLEFGRATQTRNNCPKPASSFVVVLKATENNQPSTKNQYEHTKSKRIHAVVSRQRLVQEPFVRGNTESHRSMDGLV